MQFLTFLQYVLSLHASFYIIFHVLSLHYCRHSILYPIWLGPPFLDDVGILKPKVSLGIDQIEIDLMKVFLEEYNIFMN